MTTLIERLKLDEGFRSKPYHDTNDILTVGYGYNLQENILGLSEYKIDSIEHKGISELDAEQILIGCITKCWSDLTKSLSWFDKLDRPRQEALVNMCFNLGLTKLLGFKNTLNCLKNGDYHGAAHQMLNSKWAKQVGVRATRLSKQIETGVTV
jgi:lysozyme